MSVIFKECKNNEYLFVMNFEYIIIGVKFRVIVFF